MSPHILQGKNLLSTQFKVNNQKQLFENQTQDKADKDTLNGLHATFDTKALITIPESQDDKNSPNKVIGVSNGKNTNKKTNRLNIQ